MIKIFNNNINLPFLILFSLFLSLSIYYCNDVDEYQTKHFIIRNHGVDDEPFNKLKNWAEPAYRKVGEWGENYNRITIDIYEDKDDYFDDLSDAGGGEPGEFSSGSTSKNRMFMRVNKAEGGKQFFDKIVFIHELGHVMHSYNIKDVPVPEWHSEGLAEYIAREPGKLYEIKKIANAVQNKGIRPITNENSLVGSYALYYGALASVHQCLVEEFGSENLKLLIADTDDNPVFNNILINIYGMRGQEIEDLWLDWILNQ
jgi:hypothetical protein